MICAQCGCKVLTISYVATPGGYLCLCQDCLSKSSELPVAFYQKDSVNHPSHYTSGKIEVIDFIEDQELNFHRGNAIKYLARAGKKNPEKELEDLKKAQWYLSREIEKFEKK